MARRANQFGPSANGKSDETWERPIGCATVNGAERLQAAAASGLNGCSGATRAAPYRLGNWSCPFLQHTIG